MPNFVDDVIPLPTPKAELKPVKPSVAQFFIAAAEWNLVMQCLTDMRTKLRSLLPFADFSSVVASSQVTFTNLSTGSTSWLWNFGDSTTSTAQNPVKVYSATGTYTVTLTATNALGATNVVTKTVTAVAPPITLDGPGSYKMPVSLTEWQVMPAGWKVPAYQFRGQETTPNNLVDDVQGITTQLRAGSPLHQQTLASWNAKFLKTAETATEGFYGTAGQLWNTNVQSVVYNFMFRLGALPGALRILAMMSGSNGYVSMNGSGILQLRNSGTATGTYNYNDGADHFCAVEYILGAGVLEHTGAGLWRVSTDKEQLTGTWEILPDAVKGIGGCGSFTPPVAYYGRQEAWVGTDAEALSTTGIKSLMQSRGFTVTGY